MGQVIYDTLTLDQFLRLPEAKPALEYLDGKVVQKVAAKRAHSVLQTILSTELLSFVRSRRLGLAYIELRCTYGGNSYVHDLCFIARGRIPKSPEGRPIDDVMLAPDLAIEIISPGQTVESLSARLRRCIADGARLGWLIQPRQECVYAFGQGRPVATLRPVEALSGEEVIPGFALPVATLFGWLAED